jgi:hypothetical protein
MVLATANGRQKNDAHRARRDDNGYFRAKVAQEHLNAYTSPSSLVVLEECRPTGVGGGGGRYGRG